jgi:Zn-finger nucleic acid-binding protein
MQCQNCQSFWLEESNIEILLGAQAANDMRVPSYAMPSKKLCPQCQLALYEFCYPRTEIMLAGCKSCQGLSVERENINAINQLVKNLRKLKCLRCGTTNSVDKHSIAHASCLSCGSLLKNWFDDEGNLLSAESGSVAALGMVQKQSESKAQIENDVEYEWPSVNDAQLEYKFCLFAMPVMLLIGFLFNSSEMGAAIQRIWLTMPVHELGHALTAWLTGYNAIPVLWMTITYTDSPGFIAPFLLFAVILALGRYALIHNNKLGLILVGILLLLQFIGTFILSPATSDMLITFGGDGVGIIIATLLMISFYYGKDTGLYKGALRWGFLMIGAAAFVDIYMVWFNSLGDMTKVPYGTTGGRFTDSYRLVEDYGWSFKQLINRYLYLGNLCFFILCVVYYQGLQKAKSIVVQRERSKNTSQSAV